MKNCYSYCKKTLEYFQTFDDEQADSSSDSTNDEDNDDDDDKNDSDTTLTHSPTATSTSNPQSSDEEFWLNPNNSPTDQQVTSKPINAQNLRYALQNTINEMMHFNMRHPTPVRRSTRKNLFGGSYNYNRRKREQLGEGKEEKKK